MNKIVYPLVGIFFLALAGSAYFYSSRQTATDQEDVLPVSSADEMTFFVTSVNPGNGADLGGLDGADAFCQSLAEAAGAGNKNWRAYLSAVAMSDSPSVNARDRIGDGPWRNFNGEVIANNIEELHDGNNINKETALSEKGEPISGRGDEVNQHDILTGSSPEGRAIPGDSDTTCGNWTNSGDGAAMVGHHDRLGIRDDEASRSWNSSHLSRGCGVEALASSGGGGLFYCFAR